MREDTEDAPHPTARIVGAVYLLYFLTAFVAAFLLRGLVTPGHAAATANSILTHQGLYRSGFAVDLIGNALYIVLTAFLYRLLGPVNWSISLTAAFISLAGCAVQIFAGVFRLAPLVVLTDTRLATGFSTEQLQNLALLSLSLHGQTFNISLVLFGLYDSLLGYLVFRSSFLPRFVGVLLMCAGAGWLTFLWPPFATAVSSYVLPLGALAEIVFMFWLLLRGINLSAWQAIAASRAGGR